MWRRACVLCERVWARGVRRAPRLVVRVSAMEVVSGEDRVERTRDLLAAYIGPCASIPFYLSHSHTHVDLVKATRLDLRRRLCLCLRSCL